MLGHVSGIDSEALQGGAVKYIGTTLVRFSKQLAYSASFNLFREAMCEGVYKRHRFC